MSLRILLTVLLIFCSSAVSAEGVPMDPGLWEMTMTMEMSMLPAPQVRTYTECVEESELDPEDFNMDENSPCDMGDVVIEGDKVSWSISCPGPAGDMTGDWAFTSSGDSVVGAGSMKGDMGGMSMEMNMNWEGNRIGDCE